MTARDFRRLALNLPQAAEAAHHGHPDFRVAERVFATLDYPRRGWGMIKLTPEQQPLFVHTRSGAFVPAQGAWGRGGATMVRLRTVSRTAVREALLLAWRNRAPPRVAALLASP
ncbi:MAG TPA: hypothetical protein VM736_11260 [Gemmatimonadales bacterium]|nr:hypothetical protein [Gemmatimonadales bacterium]